MVAGFKEMMKDACYEGRVGQVNQLLKRDPSLVNAFLDQDGWTPLRCASYGGHIEIVKMLLTSNADPNLQSKDGGTPLHCASMKGHTETTKVLLAYNADPNTKEENGYTPLYMASNKGHIEIVKMLLTSNADPNLQSKNGYKPGESFWEYVNLVTRQEIQQLLNEERKKRNGQQVFLSGYSPQQHQSLGSFPPQQPPSYQQPSPAYSQQLPPYQHSLYASPQQQSPSQYSQQQPPSPYQQQPPSPYQQQPPSPYQYQQQSPSPYQQPMFAYSQQQSPSHYPQQQPPSPYQQQPPSLLQSPSSYPTQPYSQQQPSHPQQQQQFPSGYAPQQKHQQFPTTNSSPSTGRSFNEQTSTGASSATSFNYRTDDVAKEDLNNNLPIKGVWDKPLLSFEEAVQIANVPTLDIDDVYSCLEYFDDVENPPPGLTIDEACAVRFYTMETPFYGAFNSALRTRERNEAKCFFPFLQLLLLAMHKLPKSKGTLFRGTKNLPSHLIEEYKKKSETKKCVFWGACSSTTTSVKTLSNPMFCGKEGNRVKFVIQDCDLGVSVQALSAIGVEKEVLLPPCLRFVVEDYVDLGNGLLEFQLRYSAPQREVIPLVPPPQFLSSSAP